MQKSVLEESLNNMIFAFSKKMKFKFGDIIYKEDSLCEYVYLISEGEVELYT